MGNALSRIFAGTGKAYPSFGNGAQYGIMDNGLGLAGDNEAFGALEFRSELITTFTTTTDVTAGLTLPAGSMVLCHFYRITTSFAGVTTLNIGTDGDTNRFVAAATPVTAGEGVITVGSPWIFQAVDVHRITFDGTPTAGAMRIGTLFFKFSNFTS